MEYPLRLNKYLSQSGIASRREADRFIEQGLVFINGKRAQLGDKVQEGDSVTLSKTVEQQVHSYVYYIFNKPRGIVSTNAQYESEQDIADIFPTSETVSVIGRLDKESDGLVLLTNDGRLSNRLLSPEHDHEKEYRVKVTTPLKERVVRIFARGMNIDGDEVKGARAEILGEKTLFVTLTEGKRHQIRRMLSALGYEVVSLTRTRIMNLTLGNLPTGSGRPLTEKEKQTLLSNLNLQ